MMALLQTASTTTTMAKKDWSVRSFFFDVVASVADER